MEVASNWQEGEVADDQSPKTRPAQTLDQKTTGLAFDEPPFFCDNPNASLRRMSSPDGATSAPTLDVALRGALQLRLVNNSPIGGEPIPWDNSFVSYRLNEGNDFDCVGNSQALGQSPSSLLGFSSEKESLMTLLRRSLFNPLLQEFEDNGAAIAAFIEQPEYSNLTSGMQCLFPTLSYEPHEISQADCPIKFLHSEADFLINDNDSQLSGLDLVEMDEGAPAPKQPPVSNLNLAPAQQEQKIETEPAVPEKPKVPPLGLNSPVGMSPSSVHKDTPSPVAAANSGPSGGDTSSAPDASISRLAYCQRIAESAIAKLAISSNPQEINQHITSLGINGGVQALEKEKRRVKFILRKYDLTYEKAFGQPPSRVEKEPMRIVYVYYRKVKLAIDKVSSTATQDATREEATHAAETLQSGASSVNQAPVEELEKKLEKMTAQKIVLARRLQAYQEAFERKHGRRIRYHRDIVEIDPDYRRYKKLRAHVSQLSEMIKARKTVMTARGDSNAK